MPGRQGDECGLRAAYLNTTYCVDCAQGRIALRIGQPNRALERLLRREQARRWAYVTACNPGSRRLSTWRNAARQRGLAQLVAAHGFIALRGAGVGDDPGWLPEASLMILEIAPGSALRLARQFGQRAIVVGRRGTAPRLLWCLTDDRVADPGSQPGAAPAGFVRSKSSYQA